MKPKSVNGTLRVFKALNVPFTAHGWARFRTGCNLLGVWSVRAGMRNTARLLGMALLLVTVTACGASPTTPPAVPPSPVQGTATPPSTATDLPGTTSVTPVPPPQSRPTQGVPPADGAIAESQVDAKTLPEGYPRTLLLADRGQTVILQAEEGGCRKISARLGDQTAQQVVVLVAVAQPKKGQMCPDYIRNISIPLALAAPLGSRTVVLRQG